MAAVACHARAVAAVACRGGRDEPRKKLLQFHAYCSTLNVNVICLLFKSFIMDDDRRVMSFVYSPRYFLMFRV
jgi:hypothetical protein